MGWRDYAIKATVPEPVSSLSSPIETEYYAALAEFESFAWLDGQPLAVIEEHYPKLQAALEKVGKLYRELPAQGMKVATRKQEAK